MPTIINRSDSIESEATIVTMKMREKPHYFGIVICALAMLLTASCAKNEDPKSKPAPAAQAANPSPKIETPAPAPTTAPPPAAPAIATAEGDMPGVRAEVQELKRTSDGLLSLKFAISNDSTETVHIRDNFADSGHLSVDHNGMGGVTLIDGAAKKKYFVVRDTEDHCVCSRDANPVSPKSRGAFFARFPAPPDGVQRITVLIPHFVPMDDVAITH